MGIDVWEVIEAAATKPFGYMPFYPGPGLGGHCIPIDPVYLQWKARIDGFEPQLIQVAQRINEGMPLFVVTRAMELLNELGRPMRGSSVHLLGMTYKKDISDVRESPAIEIVKLLTSRGARVTYSDPVRAQPGDRRPGAPGPAAVARDDREPRPRPGGHRSLRLRLRRPAFCAHGARHQERAPAARGPRTFAGCDASMRDASTRGDGSRAHGP